VRIGELDGDIGALERQSEDSRVTIRREDECKNGGWRNFGDTFKDQGQCVAFVQRGPGRRQATSASASARPQALRRR
jgi:hypothetical protein